MSTTTNPQALHAIAFLYLALGHGADGTLTGDEMRELADKLRQWVPESSLDEVGELLRAAVADYKSLSADARQRKTNESAELLCDQLDADQRARVVADLQSIAEADGTVTAEEEAFIADLSRQIL